MRLLYFCFVLVGGPTLIYNGWAHSHINHNVHALINQNKCLLRTLCEYNEKQKYIAFFVFRGYYLNIRRGTAIITTMYMHQ